jgi:hypothetical protein
MDKKYCMSNKYFRRFRLRFHHKRCLNMLKLHIHIKNLFLQQCVHVSVQ